MQNRKNNCEDEDQENVICRQDMHRMMLNKPAYVSRLGSIEEQCRSECFVRLLIVVKALVLGIASQKGVELNTGMILSLGIASLPRRTCARD
jgi:hypothetical protein